MKNTSSINREFIIAGKDLAARREPLAGGGGIGKRCQPVKNKKPLSLCRKGALVVEKLFIQLSFDLFGRAAW